jgi:hypothetical protein
MKIALCTTTIHVPHALKLMRKCSDGRFSNVKFFVVGDEKSPHTQIEVLCDACDSGKSWDVPSQSFKHEDAYMRQHHGNAEYYDVDRQKGLNYKCSEAIGWSSLSRRNIAFLEALRWGADIVYAWDNDNVNVDLNHFAHLSVLDRPFNGIKVTGDKGWFDPGQLLIPATRHRGFPYARPVSKHASPVVDARVGVAAGLVIGDPDIDATTRLEVRPDIGAVHILGSTGVVVECHTWTVFNSQNTAVIRELIPAWFMMPGVGRHDDIYASLIVQRVARERNLHVHFGPPFTYQQRNKHDLVTDLRAELDGMENVCKLATLLDAIILPGKSVIEDVRIIYTQLRNCAFIPLGAATAGLTWLEDCEEIFK